MRPFRFLSSWFLQLILFLVGLLCTVAVAEKVVKIEAELLEALDGADSKSDIVVTMGSMAELKEITLGVQEKFSHSTKEDRIHALYQALNGYSSECQGDAQSYLTSGGYDYKGMWSSNSILVKGADKACVKRLEGMKDVSSIMRDREIKMIDPITSFETSSRTTGAGFNSDIAGILDAENTAPSPFLTRMTWGLAVMRVKEAWNYNPSSYGYTTGAGYGRGELKTGKGIVVSSIDTGVNVDHHCLHVNHRKYAGWMDGYELSDTPVDDNGHGTHTMGTICGQDGIGVAPGSQWISCRGCMSDGCMISALLNCCQWILCPHDSDKAEPDDYSNCYTAPDVVSNSWGGGQGDLTFERCALALRAAGIVPVWAIGNSGPQCGTAGSPGDLEYVIGVGATDSNDVIADFSSRGPTVSGHLKPDISAPGVKVCSAWFNSSNSFVTISGTSMATPHVAGLVALILERCRLPYTSVLNVLQSTADRSLLGTTEQICGGTKSDQFPNNFYGFGRVNALDAVKQVVQLCHLNNKANSGGYNSYQTRAKSSASSSSSPYQSQRYGYGYAFNYFPPYSQQSPRYGYGYSYARLPYQGAGYMY